MRPASRSGEPRRKEIYLEGVCVAQVLVLVFEERQYPYRTVLSRKRVGKGGRINMGPGGEGWGSAFPDELDCLSMSP